MDINNNNSFEVAPLNLGNDLVGAIRGEKDRIDNTPPPEDNTPPPEIIVDPPSVDTEAPTSTVDVLPNSVTQDFSVTWYGFDSGASGIASYDIFVSTDGGEFVLWQDDTTSLSAVYPGQSDRTYEFFSVATDNAGNTESNNQAQVSTTTNGNSQQPVIYRLLNTNTGVHLYTSNVVERDSVIQNLSNYVYEGASYFAAKPDEGVPVYRFYNPIVDSHIYTASEAERDLILEDLPEYSFEGAVFTAFEEQVEGSIPIYRFFNTTTGALFYTASEGERDSIIENLADFAFEGVVFYSFPLNADFTPLPPDPEPDSVALGFEGAELSYQGYFPNLDTPRGDLLSFVVGDGVELNLADGELAENSVGGSIDLDNDSILYEVVSSNNGTYDVAEFNGVIIADLTDTLPTISNVTIDTSNTTLGIDPSDIIFIDDAIAINIEGVPYSNGDIIKLDVDFIEGQANPPEQTPEINDNNFIGAELQYQTFSPNFDTPVGELLTATVGDGIEFDLGAGGDGSTGGFVDIRENTIIYEVDFPGDSSFSEAEFNGFAIIDSTESLPTIENVTINQSGTTIGIDESDLVFTEDGLAVNVQGLPFSDGDRIQLDVDFV